MFPFLTVTGNDPFIAKTGAGSRGMACVLPVSGDIWTGFQNQAFLGEGLGFNIASNYETRYFLKELGTRSLAISVPCAKAGIGGLYSCFGYADFKRHMAALSCGMPLSKNLTAGIQIDYFLEKTTGDYPVHETLTFEAGAAIRAGKNLVADLHLFNPLPGLTGSSDLPAAMQIGVGNLINENLFAGLRIEIETGQKPSLSAGFDYKMPGKVRIRGGYCTRWSSFSFGLGYKAGPAVIDIAFYTHEKLGISSSASIAFTIIKPRRKS
ncbi:MAG: hypothetical protein U0X39_00470 [Bacteroidales bacterium]